jgi:tRNA threonylcarbamoyladenosine biosynthesis protein TsaE
VAEPLTPSPAPSSWRLADPAATAAFGAALAPALPAGAGVPLVVHLEGDLGAGKTSLVRGLLAGLGHGGRVPSPTYTLVEPYVAGGFRVLHVDLYRLRDPAELDDLGIADDLRAGGPDLRGLLLVEWPSRGGDRVPPPDLVLQLAVAGTGRELGLVACSVSGEAIRDAVVRHGLAPPDAAGR